MQMYLCEVKYEQPLVGFELKSLLPFFETITVTLIAHVKIVD